MVGDSAKGGDFRKRKRIFTEPEAPAHSIPRPQAP